MVMMYKIRQKESGMIFLMQSYTWWENLIVKKLFVELASNIDT